MTKKTYKTGKEVISCSNPDCPTHPKRKTRAKKEEK